MMKKFIFYFAIIGWALSLLIHILSIADIDVTEKIPFVWALHLGIFIVWLPAVLELRKNKELTDLRKSNIAARLNPLNSLKIIFKQTPVWLTIIAIICFIYSSINSWLLMSHPMGQAEFKDGQYVLLNHGSIIKTLTKQEYNHHKSSVMRLFSGTWIAFYGLATAILFSYFQNRNETADIIKA